MGRSDRIPMSLIGELAEVYPPIHLRRRRSKSRLPIIPPIIRETDLGAHVHQRNARVGIARD